MTGRRSAFVKAGGYEIHVSEWGEAGNPPLVLWHGLARTGRDFDELAAALADRYFVLCPDTIGRGLSQWAAEGASVYRLETYRAIACDLADAYRLDSLRWLGTSMGGLLGITLAGGPMRGRISYLVINDVGPEVPADAVARIAGYVGAPPDFPTMSAFATWIRTVYRPFGDNPEKFWARLAETSARRRDDGRFTVHYDPAIAEGFAHAGEDLNVWAAYDRIKARSLVVRGEMSDVLPEAVLAEMAGRGPRPEIARFCDVGHAPTFVSAGQQAVLRAFLSS